MRKEYGEGGGVFVERKEYGQKYEWGTKINPCAIIYTGATLPGYILPCQTTMAPYHTQGDTESIYPTTLY